VRGQARRPRWADPRAGRG